MGFDHRLAMRRKPGRIARRRARSFGAPPGWESPMIRRLSKLNAVARQVASAIADLGVSMSEAARGVGEMVRVVKDAPR